MKAIVTLNPDVSPERRARWRGYFGSESFAADVYEEWTGDILDGQTDWQIMLTGMPAETISKISVDILAQGDPDATYERVYESVKYGGVLVKCKYITVTPLDEAVRDG